MILEGILVNIALVLLLVYRTEQFNPTSKGISFRYRDDYTEIINNEKKEKKGGKKNKKKINANSNKIKITKKINGEGKM